MGQTNVTDGLPSCSVAARHTDLHVNGGAPSNGVSLMPECVITLRTPVQRKNNDMTIHGRSANESADWRWREQWFSP